MLIPRPDNLWDRCHNLTFLVHKYAPCSDTKPGQFHLPHPVIAGIKEQVAHFGGCAGFKGAECSGRSSDGCSFIHLTESLSLVTAVR